MSLQGAALSVNVRDAYMLYTCPTEQKDKLRASCLRIEEQVLKGFLLKAWFCVEFARI